MLEKEDQTDPIVLYLIVNESLGMSPGKMSAQVGHAVGKIYERLFIASFLQDEEAPEENIQAEIFHKWRQQGYRKVVLRAKTSEWEKLKTYLTDKDCFELVIDSGLTQIASGSETVIALMPMYKSQAPKIISKLQCYK